MSFIICSPSLSDVMNCFSSLFWIQYSLIHYIFFPFWHIQSFFNVINWIKIIIQLWLGYEVLLIKKKKIVTSSVIYLQHNLFLKDIRLLFKPISYLRSYFSITLPPILCRNCCWIMESIKTNGSIGTGKVLETK